MNRVIFSKPAIFYCKNKERSKLWRISAKVNKYCILYLFIICILFACTNGNEQLIVCKTPVACEMLTESECRSAKGWIVVFDDSKEAACKLGKISSSSNLQVSSSSSSEPLYISSSSSYSPYGTIIVKNDSPNWNIEEIFLFGENKTTLLYSYFEILQPNSEMKFMHLTDGTYYVVIIDSLGDRYESRFSFLFKGITATYTYNGYSFERSS